MAPRARDYLNDDEIAELRRLSTVRGLASVAFTWGCILACFALYASFPAWWSVAIGVLVIGGRQLALAILMHEAAHGLLSPHRRLNDAIGQWLCAFPLMLDLPTYRRIHLRHHRTTWTDEDPDVELARPFPVTRASLRRKFTRDLLGRTGFHRYRAFIRLAAGLDPFGRGWGRSKVESFWTAIVRLRGFIATNLVIAATAASLGHPEAFVLLWWLPAMTVYSVVMRIRSIAEHAMISDPEDPLKNTRTTVAAPWVRFFVAPHHVNYHLEHHLFMFVPHYRLPEAHRILGNKGVLDRAEVVHGYRTVLASASSAKVEAHLEDRRRRAPFTGIS